LEKAVAANKDRLGSLQIHFCAEDRELLKKEIRDELSPQLEETADRLNTVEAAASVHVSVLETTASVFEEWQPQIETSVAGVKAAVDLVRSDIATLHKSEDRGGRGTLHSQAGILGAFGSAMGRPSATVDKADGPDGHSGDWLWLCLQPNPSLAHWYDSSS
jgi:hypothetical protein